MKEDFLNYLDKGRTMRDAQKEYFAARRRHDYNNAAAHLRKSVRLEMEFDELTKSLSEKYKHGEQGNLF